MKHIQKAKSIAADGSYRYLHSWVQNVLPEAYKVHTHEVYELVFFLKGNASFVVEGIEHRLEPYDIMISRPGEMHQIYHHSQSEYERIVLTFSDSFFIHNDCISYRDIFTEREMGHDNIIPALEAEKADIESFILRLENYMNEDEENEIVIRCALIEILHVLNRIKPENAGGRVQNEAVRKVSRYINNNLSEDLSLEYLAEKFFISKYYLCHSFKKYMGITVGQYITQKRIMMAKQLYLGGHSLSEAAALAGFTDYSAFYKVCMKELGLPPREGLSRGNSFSESGDGI